MISDVALRISLLTRSVATALPALRDFNPLSISSLQKFLVNCDVGFVVLSLANFSAKDRTRLLILSLSAAFDDGSAELRAVKCFNHSSAVGELFSPISLFFPRSLRKAQNSLGLEALERVYSRRDLF